MHNFGIIHKNIQDKVENIDNLKPSLISMMH